jgi:hypothetical protein
MIRNVRHDQIVYNLRRPIRDNLWLFSQYNKPLIYGRTVCRDLASGIVMVPRADRNASYLCQFANPSTDLSRLRHPWLTLEHVQQIPCDADQIITRTPVNQPTEPMLTKMNICRDKNFHATASEKVARLMALDE